MKFEQPFGRHDQLKRQIPEEKSYSTEDEINSERSKSKLKNLFLALSVFGMSIAGSFSGKAEAGEANIKNIKEKMEMMLKEMDHEIDRLKSSGGQMTEKEVAESLSKIGPEKNFGENEETESIKQRAEGMSKELDELTNKKNQEPFKSNDIIIKGMPYTQEDVEELAGGDERGQAKESEPKTIEQDPVRIEKLFSFALDKISEEVKISRDYNKILNPSLRRDVQRNNELTRHALNTLLKNPEKAQLKLLNENTLLISFEYNHPDSGYRQFFDYIYRLVEKK